MEKDECALLIFSKAPVPGKVKTRLISELGSEGAASLYIELVKKTLLTTEQSSIDSVTMYCTPDENHLFFRSCAANFNLRLQSQKGFDLGDRMANAMMEALDAYSAVIIIGCDCPALSVDDLDQAAEKLASGCNIVLGPSEDGGYYLIGLTGYRAELFEDMVWGRPDVLAITRERVRLLELESFELPAHWDVDKPDDFYRYLNGNHTATH